MNKIEKVEVKRIKHTLSEDEKLEAAGKLTDALSSIDRLEEELVEMKARNKAEKEIANASAQIERSKLQCGYEFRKVECKIIIETEAKTITIIRADNGEVVEDRPMTADEMETLPGMQ